MKLLIMTKRLFKTPLLIIMLIAISILTVLCGSLARDDGMPSCGIVSGDGEVARSIAKALSDEGLILCESEEELKEKLVRGELAMGAILPSDLCARLESGDTDNMIRFIETPLATMKMLYRYRIAAHVMEAYTPYLASKLLKDRGFDITPAEMQEAIDDYLQSECEFMFTIETAEGKEISVTHYSKQLTVGAVALLLFFLFGIYAVPYPEKELLQIARRIGLKKAMLSYALPQIYLLTLAAAVCTAAALMLSQKIFGLYMADILKAAIIYLLFLSALFTVATALFRSAERFSVPLIGICLLSLGFCPIFADLPALIGIPKEVGYILPTMFLYAAKDSPTVCTLVAVSLSAIASLILYASYKKRFNLK